MKVVELSRWPEEPLPAMFLFVESLRNRDVGLLRYFTFGVLHLHLGRSFKRKKQRYVNNRAYVPLLFSSSLSSASLRTTTALVICASGSSHKFRHYFGA